MKVFKVGDRVSVRRGGFDEPIRGTVSAVHDKYNALFVTEDGFISGHSDSPFHPCQVRKLVKKKKVEWGRGLWVRTNDGGMSASGGKLEQEVSFFKPKEGTWVFFRESTPGETK